MTKPGHIEITDKVRFVYYELEKPDSDIYERARNFNFDDVYYTNEIKKYEASKRTIEVCNAYSISKTLKHCHISFKDKSGKLIDLVTNIPDNQPCKAEVKDNKATIIELTKE